MKINAYKLDLASAHNYLRVESESVKSGSGGTLITVSTKEQEELKLSADGYIQTKDKNISINLKADLFSQSTTAVDVAARNGKRIDPLIINLNGSLAQIDADAKFDFDLDSDGNKDNISMLSGGNGFLALDLNENGAIDNGNELFGTKSGNGFADLVAYDDNKDGVIDESDTVFAKLKVWSKTVASEKLVSLNEAKVGALLLDNVNSEFELKNKGSVNAKIQKSGVVIFEDGAAGWISHLDFTLHGEDKKALKLNTAQGLGKTIAVDKGTQHTIEIKPINVLELLKKMLEIVEAKLQKEDNKEEKQQLEMQKMRLNEQISLIERGGR